MTLRSNKKWLIVSMTVSFLLHASVTWATSDKISFSQVHLSTVYVGITQTGLQNNTHYVFCDDSDCPSPTVKHRFMADMVNHSPLLMPLPSVELPAHHLTASPNQLLNKKRVKRQKDQRPIQKSKPKCITENN